MKSILVPILVLLLLSACVRTYKQNPDPNHTHADFAVWIEGEQLDLTSSQYMSGGLQDENHHDGDDHLHPHLHLHDAVGHVIHRHKPGLSIQEFFNSIGITLDSDCVRFDARRVCNTDTKRWRMYLRNASQQKEWSEAPYVTGYVFKDMDQILLTYGAPEEDMLMQQEKMTEDACLYSKTCPWRGDPPVENCVADPAIPCVE